MSLLRVLVELLCRLEDDVRAAGRRVCRGEGAARSEVWDSAVCLHGAERILAAVQRTPLGGGSVSVESQAVLQFDLCKGRAVGAVM